LPAAGREEGMSMNLHGVIAEWYRGRRLAEQHAAISDQDSFLTTLAKK
jgi:hypothetical protein